MSQNRSDAPAAVALRLVWLRRQSIVGALAVLVVLAIAGVGLWPWLDRAWLNPGDLRLREFIHTVPPVPIVFTSRTEPASLFPAAPDREEFCYPGAPLWQAREGRLRLLKPNGTVHELTWGKKLPDGGTLIDVMSPSVSPDGKTILFAGRRNNDGHGHFRIYEVGINGKGLRQVTGGADDPGCTAVPPMRFKRPGDSSMMSGEERKRVDYDDVDPMYYPDGHIIFASSRVPDLGRGHSRRATHLWSMKADGSEKVVLTANRNNDRWPIAMHSGYITFTLWSRNTEVLAANGRDIQPHEPGMACLTQPTDSWPAAMIQADGTRPGVIVKPRIPVWRARPLFNGRFVFMTTWSYNGIDDQLPQLQLAQAASGLISDAPSSLAGGRDALPKQKDVRILRGPAADQDGKPLILATPSPCPSDELVLSGGVRESGEEAPAPGRFALYLMSQNWPEDSDAPAAAAAVNLRKVFDDPDFVDAEPVAVYPRKLHALDRRPLVPPPPKNAIGIEGPYDGRKLGFIMNNSVYTQVNPEMPGQRTDIDEGPLFAPPPDRSIAGIRFYASHRDRFDDSDQPRVKGGWELLRESPINRGTDAIEVSFWTPSPIVLAAYDRSGNIVRWTAAAKDSLGRQATFYGYAGDHYSGIRANRYELCTGCHAGHSTAVIGHHGERRAD